MKKKKRKGSSLPMVKNPLFRHLWGILDPRGQYADEHLLWEHFDNKCAFCSVEVSKEDKTHMLDHAVSHKDKGGNHLGNMLLTCIPCNNNKRDVPWFDFLTEKAESNEQEFHRRKERIESWLTQDHGRVNVSNEAVQAFEDAKTRISAVIAEEVIKLQKYSPE